MPVASFQDLHKIKVKKEQKVKEYYKSFIKGPGLDKIKIPLTTLSTTKKKRLHMTPAKKTMKQIVKTTQLAPPTIKPNNTDSASSDMTTDIQPNKNSTPATTTKPILND